MTPTRELAAAAVRAWLGTTAPAASVGDIRAQRRARILDLRAGGLSYAQIAAEIGCSAATAAGIVRAAQRREGR